MNRRVVAVVKKEFMEYRRNKLIVTTMVLMPLIFLVAPVATLLALPAEVAPADVRPLVGQAMLFFLLVPVLLPSTIAAYTVIGEREQRTLEPLLTTPVTDRELLVGKALAATVPAVILGWSFFGIFLLVVSLWAPAAVGEELATGTWALAQLTLGPGLGALAIEVGMAISTRSTDMRVAQQVAGLAMLPVMGLLALFSFEVIEASAGGVLALATVVAAVDVVGWRGVTALFDRERLLTRFG